MTVNYNKLWKILVDRGMKRMELKNAIGIGSSTLAKLGKNQTVGMDVLGRICDYFDCNIGDIMDMKPDKMSVLKDVYTSILREELLPAMGCTEPSSIAFVAAKARETLGALPERSVVTVCGNLIKNAKSAVIPRTNGMKGIQAAVATGFVTCSSEAGLEVLEGISPEDVPAIANYVEKRLISVVPSDNEEIFYMSIEVFNGDDSARVVLNGGHLRITLIEKNGKELFSLEEAILEKTKDAYMKLNIEDIIEFSDVVPIDEIRPLIQCQIDYNYAIALEGLKNDWGANVGRTMLSTYGNDIKTRAAAAAAAGCDARMSGCDMPVVIVSGSGNQGIASSVPVIEYAKELKVSNEKLIRALILSDLVTIHQKTDIGKLSAFCGAVSSGCGAAAGIAYILYGADYDKISHTIVNSLAIVSGIVCDGAKPSCAAKIAVSVQTGLLGLYMYAHENKQFYDGEGIVRQGVDNTIRNVGRMASKGMRETDKEILRIMSDNC